MNGHVAEKDRIAQLEREVETLMASHPMCVLGSIEARLERIEAKVNRLLEVD